MNNDLIGINEEKIDKLILEIYDYIEKINNIFSNIDSCILESANYFVCDEFSNYLDKFSKCQEKFQIVNKNIATYIDDLLKVKNNYINFNSNLSVNIMQAESSLNVD